MATALARARDERDQEGIPLFAPHEKVYPRHVQGPIRRLKWAVLILCLTLYYVGPGCAGTAGPPIRTRRC